MDGTVRILYGNQNADAIIAAAGRISTTQGSADEIYRLSCEKGAETNQKLIAKILQSGHQSVLEHVSMNLSFDRVSVFVEQFMIEFRLASFTVKSRRYVDFGGMGYFEPEGLTEDLREAYRCHAEFLFAEYDALVEAGVPKEDARFVLPYCFRSNFYCTVNARELLHIMQEMLYGRGARYPEIRRLGEMLREACEEQYPYLLPLLKEETDKEVSLQVVPKSEPVSVPEEAVSLLFAEKDAAERVCTAYAFYHAMPGVDLSNPEYRGVILAEILKSRRKRELEQVSFTFRFNRISLAGLTHLARHRMQALMVPDFTEVCDFTNYVMPESVRAAGCEERYRAVFSASEALYQRLKKGGLSKEDTVYLMLSGMRIPVMTTMNANELLIFMKLRTCNRAQWEIKGLADALLSRLRKMCPELFSLFGPSCVLEGRCPEGKMSCMKMREMREQYRGLETSNKDIS